MITIITYTIYRAMLFLLSIPLLIKPKKPFLEANNLYKSYAFRVVQNIVLESIMYDNQ